MGIEAGKFFINLGLTGAEKTLGGLAQVNDHFSGLKSISTEAKLAILAALAGLEQMVSVSGQFGTNTKLTAEALGVQTRELQKWNNAFQIMTGQAGQGTAVLKGVHDLMFNIQTGQGASPFFPTLMSALNASGYKYSKDELLKQSNLWLKDPSKFMPELMAMAKLKTTEVAKLAGMLEKSGLLSNPQFSALRNITPGVIHEAGQETISNADIERLNKINQKWQDFGLIMKKVMDEFASRLGPAVDKLLIAAKLLDKFMQAQNRLTDSDLVKKDFHSGMGSDIISENWEASHAMSHVHNPKLEGMGQSSKVTNVTVNAPITYTNNGSEGYSGAEMEDFVKGIWTKTISKMYSTKAQ